jgi:hypothetical protein
MINPPQDTRNAQFPEEVKEIICSGDLGFIVQCGGKAKRFERDIKAFASLPKCIDSTESPKFLRTIQGTSLNIARTPLGMVLRDIPAACPVYLHTYNDLDSTFTEELSAVSYYGHRTTILRQHLEKGKICIGGLVKDAFREDGTCIDVSDGPATMWFRFGSGGYPKYFAFVDGCLLGLYFNDIANALNMLVKDDSSEIVAFAQKLTDEQMKDDLYKKKKRFARINRQVQTVYDNENNSLHLNGNAPFEIPEGVIMSEKWLGLLGIYVARAESYLSLGKKLEGILLETESANSVYKNILAHHIKMPMVLKGFNGNGEGLKFLVYEPEYFIPAIKSEEDVKQVPFLVAQGGLDYRKNNFPNNLFA